MSRLVRLLLVLALVLPAGLFIVSTSGCGAGMDESVENELEQNPKPPEQAERIRKSQERKFHEGER